MAAGGVAGSRGAVWRYAPHFVREPSNMVREKEGRTHLGTLGRAHAPGSLSPIILFFDTCVFSRVRTEAGVAGAASLFGVRSFD